MNQRIFVTNTIPKWAEYDNNVSVAAGNFTHNLISGANFNKIYSIMPISVHRKFRPENGIIYLYCWLRILGNTGAKFAAVFEQLKLFFKIPSKSNLWLYNLTELNEFLYIFLRLFKPSVHIYTIVLDYTPNYKKGDRHLKMINSSDGLIVLSNNKLFTNQNKVCLPGVVPLNIENFPLVEMPIKRKFLLSGVLLEQISQISKILSVFSRVPKYELHITGTGCDLEALERYKNYKNIIYHGKISWDEYLTILHSCPFVLSTRDVNAPENGCNFPSKIIESLLHNRIVISTINYAQLKDIKLLTIGNELYEMKRDFSKIDYMTDTELLTYANQSVITKKMFSCSIWYEAIKKIEKNIN